MVASLATTTHSRPAIRPTPVMMLAEKAADLILGRAPLAPDYADFYRHGSAAAPETAPSLDHA